MTSFDLIAIAIIGVSVAVSLFRGLVAELISLLSWVLAFWCAQEFSSQVIKFLPLTITQPGARAAIAFVLIFLCVRILSALLQSLITALLKASGLNIINRTLGMLFGLGRGVLLVCALVLVAGFTKIPQSEEWQKSALIAPFEQLVLDCKTWLPKDIAQNINYPTRNDKNAVNLNDIFINKQN